MTKLLFDIETGPLTVEEIRANSPPFKRENVKLGNRTNEKVIEQFLEEEEASYWKEVVDRAALEPVASRVLVICYRNQDGRTRFSEGSEREILKEFWDRASSAMRKGGSLIGFNIKNFDVPYLVRRSWVVGELDLPPNVYAKGKWLSEVFIDLREMWQCGVWENKFCRGDLGYFGKLFGGPGKTGDGKDFAGLYEKDREAAIAYCECDLDNIEAMATRLGTWRRNSS